MIKSLRKVLKENWQLKNFLEPGKSNFVNAVEKEVPVHDSIDRYNHHIASNCANQIITVGRHDHMVAAIEDGVEKIGPHNMSIKIGNIYLTVILDLRCAGSFFK